MTATLEVKRAVGYCPDVGGLVPRATPWEHLQLSAALRRLDDWEEPGRDLLEQFGLGDVAHRVVGGFSHGMSRRLSVVLAALHQPAVLLLDEPFDGVDPIGVDATLEVIADARARGACVLISTHLRELALEACTSAIVLRGGSRVAATAGGRAQRRGLPCPPRLRAGSAPPATRSTSCASAPGPYAVAAPPSPGSCRPR